MALTQETWDELIAASERVITQNEKIRHQKEAEMPEARRIAVYVCPTPGCQRYYGASGMPDLSTMRTGERGLNGEALGRGRTLDTCPDCLSEGRSVKLLLTTATVHLSR